MSLIDLLAALLRIVINSDQLIEASPPKTMARDHRGSGVADWPLWAYRCASGMGGTFGCDSRRQPTFRCGHPR